MLKIKEVRNLSKSYYDFFLKGSPFKKKLSIKMEQELFVPHL